MVLQGIRDATTVEYGQRRASDTATWLRAAALGVPRNCSPELAAGWRTAVLNLAERALGSATPDFEAIETARYGGDYREAEGGPLPTWDDMVQGEESTIYAGRGPW
jgi:hypothetical protein